MKTTKHALLPIAVLGAGSWGTALAIQLARNGVPVRLWGRNVSQMQEMADRRENCRYLPGCALPDLLTCHSCLEEAIEGVSDWLIVVPSVAFSALLERLSSLGASPRIAWATKGLDPSSSLLDKTVQSFFPRAPLAVLSGPSLAVEVAAGLPTAVVVAGTEESFCHDLVAAFHSDTFRVYRNDDMTGVELCSALKNVLAIAAGISDGMGLGANARSALLTRGMVEMKQLCQHFDADPKTLMGLAGLGDLMLTATDDRSRNRRLGLAIGQGLSIDQARGGIDQVVEGMVACELIHHLIQRESLTMPITEQVYAVLFANLSPKEALQQLMLRQPRMEAE